MPEYTTTFEEAFDPTKEEGTPPRTLLPAGKYRAEATDSSVSETKNGKGTMLNLTCKSSSAGRPRIASCFSRF